MLVSESKDITTPLSHPPLPLSAYHSLLSLTMLFVKSILASATLLAIFTFSYQANAALPNLLCKIPLEQDLPKKFASYELASTKVDDYNWDFTFPRDKYPNAPRNMDFQAHIKQQTSSGLIIEIDNHVTWGPAPRKNYFYTITSTGSGWEDKIQYWLSPPDQCWNNHNYPGTTALFADSITVTVHEYDV